MTYELRLPWRRVQRYEVELACPRGHEQETLLAGGGYGAGPGAGQSGEPGMGHALPWIRAGQGKKQGFNRG